MKILCLPLNRHLLWFGLLLGCTSNAPKQTESKATDALPDFKSLVHEWNDAHLGKDVGVFSRLFNDSVLFYGKIQDKNACIESKLALFKIHPDYDQEIFGDVLTQQLNGSEMKCSFVKRVKIDHTATDYPAYLIFKKIGEAWKISSESDIQTDVKLKEAPKTVETSANTIPVFIDGLKNVRMYSMDETENGSEYNYTDGRKFKVKFYFEQVDIMFYTYNENNQRYRLMTDFVVGYSPVEKGMPDLKRSTTYLLGQYDFNADDIDELLIAIKDNDKTDNGISINVFQLTNDRWQPMGLMTGRALLWRDQSGG